MLVTIKYNQPIGDCKAIEKTEKFYAKNIFKPAGSSLIYFKVNDFIYKAVSKNELISIEQEGR